MLHLQNILPLLKQHKKFIFLFTFLITIGTGLLLFFIPPEYKSVATLTPLNPQLADKATLFNPNIKDLYSIFGNGNDIERMEEDDEDDEEDEGQHEDNERRRRSMRRTTMKRREWTGG